MRPLSGMPVGITQSNALMRSVATKQQPIAQVVHVAHLAAADGQSGEASFQECGHGQHRTAMRRRVKDQAATSDRSAYVCDLPWPLTLVRCCIPCLD